MYKTWPHDIFLISRYPSLDGAKHWRKRAQMCALEIGKSGSPAFTPIPKGPPVQDTVRDAVLWERWARCATWPLLSPLWVCGWVQAIGEDRQEKRSGQRRNETRTLNFLLAKALATILFNSSQHCQDSLFCDVAHVIVSQTGFHGTQNPTRCLSVAGSWAARLLEPAPTS